MLLIIFKKSHIGSTAVPGLCAKPIIDIMPVVKDISEVNGFSKKIALIGYEAMGEYAALKQDLAGRFPHDIVSYVNGKADLVRLIDGKARGD